MFFQQKGFTLLELIIVLFVVVLGFSVISVNLSTGNDATVLQAASRDFVSALNYARGESMLRHEQVAVDFNLTDNSYKISSENKQYLIDKDIDVTVVTAQNEITQGQARLRFFPDGSSTGGKITLEKNKAVWRIDINWLTGHIELFEPQ